MSIFAIIAPNMTPATNIKIIKPFFGSFDMKVGKHRMSAATKTIAIVNIIIPKDNKIFIRIDTR
jgi:hypothetical protein